MLELRPNCECCDCDLPPASGDARICSYECTFCARCVEDVLAGVCPNCGGGFVPRPIRPRRAHRTGVSLADHPAATQRRHMQHDVGELETFIASLREIPPEAR